MQPLDLATCDARQAMPSIPVLLPIKRLHLCHLSPRGSDLGQRSDSTDTESDPQLVANPINVADTI
ncbi:hypothetical protein PAXRUDRAFT_825672 [Paxillus rubicundulus Ve08.2h10]|uniref:Uncharacterized protein n=1 Tax=Paxillus rubicundulus Ve08.2h10 TaxID=930991 RepID=A0A0D0EAK6_9AGAM|nr:hypothetical protein PAXRUDRAFT_825672 [Paxillus rubicundulus Ve08.2h10]